ncbi:GNAT family N-acetyltransferase [Nocardioides houyundeii]|uniref:GNAT family N-acetyltransferase n=1 Tax=Nocardioides houyundeii TaxID=2045452 RepID=UPI000DF37DE0|nr:GNAT family N-acetyltransferase [Nocardioides houyundeii]
MTVRAATPDDVPAILALIHELAVYEREPDAVRTTEADLGRVLFPADGPAAAFCHVALDGEVVVGIAVWFLSFSTWTGRHGIWLEDLFVSPAHRGRGLGKELLRTLAEICLARGYTRLEWWVLDWNAPSIAFYQALGAVAQDEWTTYRLDGEALSVLGGSPGRTPRPS